jgi:hypothetical protein
MILFMIATYIIVLIGVIASSRLGYVSFRYGEFEEWKDNVFFVIRILTAETSVVRGMSV